MIRAAPRHHQRPLTDLPMPTTAPRSDRARQRALADLQARHRACTRCVDAGWLPAARPVFSGRWGQRVMLVGQALVPDGATVTPDDEHDEFAWWPPEPDRWPDEAHEALRRVATLVSS